MRASVAEPESSQISANFVFFCFYQCWRLSSMSWEINTSSIHLLPSEDSKVKMGAKAVVLTMTTFENLYKQVPSSHVWWPFVDLGRAIRSSRRRPIWSLGHHYFSRPIGKCHSQGYIARLEKTSITTELRLGHTSCAWGFIRSSRCFTIMIIWGLKNVCLVCLFLPILCHGKRHVRDRRSLRPHLENHMSLVSMVI